jgi:hypothetical protein
MNSGGGQRAGRRREAGGHDGPLLPDGFETALTAPGETRQGEALRLVGLYDLIGCIDILIHHGMTGDQATEWMLCGVLGWRAAESGRA